MSTYAEKLQDPRWQKKRLKVLERDKWTCQWCGNTEMTLHVHHMRYAKSGNPWGSKLEDLETLCEQCHGEKAWAKGIKKEISAIIDRIQPPEVETMLAVARIVRDSPNTRTTLKLIVVYFVERVDRLELSIKANMEEKRDDG